MANGFALTYEKWGGFDMRSLVRGLAEKCHSLGGSRFTDYRTRRAAARGRAARAAARSVLSDVSD